MVHVEPTLDLVPSVLEYQPFHFLRHAFQYAFYQPIVGGHVDVERGSLSWVSRIHNSELVQVAGRVPG